MLFPQSMVRDTGSDEKSDWNSLSRGSRRSQEIVPVLDVRVHDSLTYCFQPVNIPNGFQSGHGSGVWFVEFLGPLAKQQPTSLLEPAVVDNSAIRR